jgi:hypothetical protein
MATANPTAPARLAIFVATKQTQGKRRSDFCWCEEDEPVHFSSQCDGNDTIDGGCGCQRSMSGMTTLKATTTVRVKESDMTREQYIQMLVDSYKKGGWGGLIPSTEIHAEADELLRLAAAFPVGTVIEKRGDELRQRA